ncbi:MAG: response regulator [Candidatus Adiutrix sp.]|jgi:putative two-component system response regulator|nr:response regulator [Candidatus Adiutrix sp.]
MSAPTSNDSRKLIMMVDDNLANLATAQSALSDDYALLTVPSPGKMLELLERHTPKLILLDVDMPEMSGFEAIKLLKNRAKTRDIPVIFLTALSHAENEIEGLSLGAIDYVAKPFSPPLLKKRIEMHLLVESQRQELRNYNDNLMKMVEAKTKTVLKLQNKLLTAMAELVEGRDSITGSHIERTRRTLGILLARVLEEGLYQEEASGWDMELLLQSSQLHDVGKIAINDVILKKPGKLTEDEAEEMKKHVAYGIGFIERLEDEEDDSLFLRYAETFAGYHHENWDGSGYPRGLKGEAIPLLGRLMALADVYDALTSDRPYKKAFSHSTSVAIIREGSGTHFDPALVSLFERVADEIANQAEPPQ